jgi:hypothetical protein
MKKSYPSQCIFLLKVLLFALFHMGAVGNSWAQMDHSSHSGLSASKKPKNSCIGNGLDCANAATPFLSVDGKLFLTWTAGGAVSFAQSNDLGKTFNAAVKIAEHGKSLDAGSDARSQIAADSSGNIFLAYAFFKDSNWNAQINTSRSNDGGNNFSVPVSLIEDGSSQRFPSILIRPDGSIFAAWIDKRLVASAKQSGVKKLGASIAYSFSGDHGRTFQVERIANESSCECCRIGTALDVTSNPIMIYRAIFPGGIRDHATQIISSRGAEPIRRVSDDQWKTDACPHHGPTIAVSRSGKIHAAWFTQGETRSGVFYANSSNQGRSYGKPTRIGADGANISRPYILALENTIYLVWKEFNGKSSTVYLKKSTDDGGTWSSPRAVFETSGYSDHPLLISQGNVVYLSWLTRDDGYQFIKISSP